MCDYIADIDAGSVRTLSAVADAADRTGVGWIVTGAMARSLIFEAVHDCAGGRYTRDWDLGVRVEDWSHFRMLEERLLDHAGFRSDSRKRQRMHASGGMIVDLIPFGGVDLKIGESDRDGSREIFVAARGFSISKNLLYSRKM